jgi:16S rRNA (cytidine1402-2'-O)-methyltransferase
MTGTLYIVGIPAGEPDHITRRALRTLGEVALVVAEGDRVAHRVLTHHGIQIPQEIPTNSDAVMDTLAVGDVAILSTGWLPGPSRACCQLIQTAIERGVPVVPIPGPSFPVTALVASGLPADSFVYLGALDQEPATRRDLLSSVSTERRTLVARLPSDRLLEALADLHDTLGDRPLVIFTTQGHRSGGRWQGTVSAAQEHLPEIWDGGSYVLVIGGARGQAVRWTEDRLRAEILVRLNQGLGAKKVSQQLIESGWPRREIYNLAVKSSQRSPDR